MNERIKELAKQSGAMFDHMTWVERDLAPVFERFAELIVRDCQDNLAWHGHDEAVSQLDWLKAHKLGIK